MNRRIKELLDQSGLQPYYDAQEGQIDEFAKLIVAECIKIIEVGMDHYDHDPLGPIEYQEGELAGLRWARRAIKEELGKT